MASIGKMDAKAGSSAGVFEWAGNTDQCELGLRCSRGTSSSSQSFFCTSSGGPFRLTKSRISDLKHAAEDIADDAVALHITDFECVKNAIDAFDGVDVGEEILAFFFGSAARAGSALLL